MKLHCLVILVIPFLVACAAGPTGAQRADVQKAKEAGIPITVTAIAQSRPNSAGGVDASLNFTNISDRTFKYVRFNVASFNGVGDRVS